jgi:hypothetical protein
MDPLPDSWTTPPPELPWTVYIDDNFHYMDEDSRTLHGRFATLAEAISACMAITKRSVEEYGDGFSQFGEDAWVLPRPPAGELAAVLAAHPEWPAEPFAGGHFSAWTYARHLLPKNSSGKDGNSPDGTA